MGLACLLMEATALAAETAPPPRLIRAHAHNDYLHPHPLSDALAQGFGSVEADIWLVGGALLVAHDLEKASPERTLSKLYLDPLRALVKTNAPGAVVPSLTLLIDIKSGAEATYAALREVLGKYTDILTRFESNTVQPNAIVVILSGNRPFETMRGERVRFAALDGRLPDLETNPPVALVPLISDNWTKHFSWRGVGALPPEERTRLVALARRTHAQGRRLRLWAAPDNPAGWRELYEAGVDLLNTDQLVELGLFLQKQPR